MPDITDKVNNPNNENDLEDRINDMREKTKPSFLSKLLGLGLMGAATYFLGPVIGSLGTVGKIAGAIGISSQLTAYGLAALLPGGLGYAIPTSISRYGKAKAYEAEMARKKAEVQPEPQRTPQQRPGREGYRGPTPSPAPR